MFMKTCYVKAACNQDDNPTCKGAVGSFECNISCCDSDDCNAGSAFRISGILLLACALVSLMIIVKA